MALVLVNGDVTPAEYAAGTWGELLARLDEQCSVHGEVLVAVRLGALELPDFRTPAALAQVLTDRDEVFIETALPAALIRQTLDDAETAAAAIAQAAVALGAAYRAPDVSAANNALPGFAESLSSLIVVTSTVAENVGVDLSAAQQDASSPVGTLSELIGHIDALLAARQSGDWARLGDLLQTEIASTMRRWPTLLVTIRNASSAMTGVA